jgi:hypothetical protein
MDRHHCDKGIFLLLGHESDLFTDSVQIEQTSDPILVRVHFFDSG